MIREKAHFFASTCGSPDGKEKVLSTRWLERFKQKYSFGSAKSRRGSYDTNKSSSNSPTRLSINSGLASTVNSPTLLSPTSPSGFGSPSPLSPSQSHENIKNDLAEGLANLAGDYHHQQQQQQQQQQQHQHQHQHQHQQKDTNSSDATGSSSLSAEITSPTSTLVSEGGPFSPTSQSHFTPPDVNQNNTRNQIFPFATVDPNMISEEQQRQQQQQQQQQHHIIDQSQSAPSKNAIQDSLSLAILEPPFEMENADISNTIKRNRSNPEIKAKPIYPSSYSKSTTVSPISPPCSPTQDEARRALELVMNYFQQQPTGLCAQEYVTIGKLMERLDLAKNQSNMLPGGLTRINEHDVPSHMNRKGSIQSIHGLV